MAAKPPRSRRRRATVHKPELKPLPEAGYSYTLVKKVRVHADYHVEIDKHYYSVPCSLLGLQLGAWISGELVRLFNQRQEVAAHPRNRNYGYSTREEHMRRLTASTPPGHRNGFWSGPCALAAKPMTTSFIS